MTSQSFATAVDLVAETVVRFPALDGYDLGGTLYVPAAVGKPTIAVLLTCGAGIPAARYARFARFLAANGIPVLTFDYRGIGRSRPLRLRGFCAVAEDWSEFDCGGAVAHLRSCYPRAELVGIGHSYGAVLIGGAQNVSELSRFVFICAHTGFYRDYMRRYQLPMAILWHGVMPLVTRAVGYFPASLFRLGDDIPAGVALQWAARRTPQLRPEATTSNAMRARLMISRYEYVRGRALVVGFTDDAFATPVGTQRFLNEFSGLSAEWRLIAPSEAGMSKVGHFGFFRRQAETSLWPLVTTFLRDRPTGLGPVGPAASS